MYLMLRKPSQKDRVLAYEYVGMRYRQEVDAKGNLLSIYSIGRRRPANHQAH